MNGEGLWSEGEEVGDGLGSCEPVSRGSSGLSVGGQGDSVFDGRG